MRSRMMKPSLGGFVPLLTLILSLVTLPHFTYQQHYGNGDWGSPPSPPADTHNPRLERAYAALQAWKHTFTCDPSSTTSDWHGPHVCNYTGVFCAPAPDDSNVLTVAVIDLNHAGICGSLHNDLGHLTDLAVLHLNSNRFCGTIPVSFRELSQLYELDLSNNHLSGSFPSTVLHLPSLRYLDLRYNFFTGDVPCGLFDKKNLDAVFLNNNNFRFFLPENIGNYRGSALVLANTHIQGCIPRSISRLADTLDEILLINTGLSACIPPEIGHLHKLTVLDVSQNRLLGQLPETIGYMESLEQLNVANNLLTGDIPESICELSNLKNFTYSDNYFTGEPTSCINLSTSNDSRNCIPDRPLQRPENDCRSFLSNPPVHCGTYRGGMCWVPPRSIPSAKYHHK